MKKIFSLSLFAVALLWAGSTMAQKNIDEILSDPSNNYFVIKQKADSFFARVGTVRTGWKQYKRWEAFVRNNIQPNGDIPDFDRLNRQAYSDFKANYQRNEFTEAGVSNWLAMGQSDPTIQAGDAQNGAGSLRCIEFSGSNIWSGGAGGGLWLGTFLGGSSYSWVAKTDGVSNLSAQDVVVAPTSSSTLYLLTGAVGGFSGYRSTGVLKSTDGGNNWLATGLTFPVSGSVKGYKIVCSATNANVVWACTTSGLYRTSDGGTSWNLVTYSTTVGGAQVSFNAETFDLEYQPGSTTVMYATSTNYFYKSTDGGVTFLRTDNLAAGLPATGDRIEIGVTAANSAYIYLLYGNGTSYQGLYRSVNSGSSFTLRSNTPNVLGSQAWRNICIDVSPTNVNDIYVGGLDVFKSVDGGAFWTQISDWTSASTTNFCHADIFDLYCDATYLYAATDGGIYRMTRSTDTWVDIHQNMQIAQAYRIGIDPTASAAFVTMGNQDNGTYKNSYGPYLSIGGGDGMETVVKPSNTNVIYLSTQNGNFYRSDDGGTSNTFIRSGPGNWTTPAVLRPANDNHIYLGFVNIDYNTTSGAGAWSTITTGFASAIESLEFAPTNSTILYATDGATVKRFNLSAGVWSVGVTINGSLPALSGITELAVDPTDANHILISIGGYTATQKVYETFNANLASPTWNPIVRNLPNVPVNCIVMDNDAANTIYIGTDIGVFVTNDNRVNWLMYNNGLPQTRIYDLEINYALATNRIFAGTFGRGVFYAEVYTGCTSTTTLVGAVTGLEYSEVSLSITSTQTISGGDGTSVGYNAGSVITMNSGFEVKAGSKFEAYILGCTGAGSPPRPLRMIPINRQGQPLQTPARLPSPDGND
ncbi:MAG: hypothetical protein NTW29_21445 [Bacteroidetes bacterium]|nr:hypothetical protein [Bacteroidota bacterium]